MTKHDEVRKILHESGFTFKDSDRTALDMTDEEVDEWLSHFFTRMAEVGRQMSIVIGNLTVAVGRAITPLQDLGRLLNEGEKERA